MSRTGPAVHLAKLVAGGLLFLLLVDLSFGLSLPNLVNGLALGSLYGIVGVALILIYRTSKVINFAAAAVGGVPAITALLLVIQKGANYVAMLPIAALGGLLIGALADIVVMRRFAKAPRLVAVVVTIGLAQSFAALGFFIPVWLGAKASQIPSVPTPWANVAFRNGRGQPVLSGNQVFAFVVVITLTTGLALFLRYTRLGIALRAAAENSDRAQLLGIPVDRITTAAWAIAGLLAALAIYAQAPLIGVPNDATLGFDALLYGLTAAVVARMERMGLALYIGMGIGVLIFCSVAKTGTYDYATGFMLILILVALYLQRRTGGRAHDTGVSSFQSVRMFRAVPLELRSLREVVVARICLFALAIALAVVLPFVVGAPYVPTLTVLPLYGIAAVSLVILTGWAGQISLGQFGLIGIGAACAGGLAANHNIDFFLAVAIGIAAGAVTAVIVGLPAVRIQGLYLAVTTLAFGAAMESYILNPNYWLGRHLLPSGLAAHLVRPVLYGKIDLENNRSFYFVCVAFLALSMAAALAFRAHHGGRVVMAIRDNERAATSYAINPTRTKLSAFAVSGAIAGLAGTLFAYLQHNVIPGAYNVQSSIFLFLAAAVAGLTSVYACVVGVMAFEAIVLFGPNLWHHLGTTFSSVVPLLLTGPLLILSLYLNPGGLAEQAFGVRDRFLRWAATRHSVVSPSILADLGDRLADTADAPLVAAK